jgi:hypothetical protein
MVNKLMSKQEMEYTQGYLNGLRCRENSENVLVQENVRKATECIENNEDSLVTEYWKGWLKGFTSKNDA